VTRIGWDGTMQRRMVDTAQRSDSRQWEDLAARALALLPLYRPVPRVPVYHVRVDDQVVQAAERDLAGALRDLITAVLSQGEELLAAGWLPRRNAAAGLPAERGRRSRIGHPATGRIRPVITA